MSRPDPAFPPLGHFFARIKRRKNHNIAVVAVARKLAMIAWQMLVHNEPYRYAIPKTTDAKLSRLRIRATGQKKKGGFAKGSKRPAAYGTGQRTRAVPALNAVYEKEELPPLAPPRPGETKMLAEKNLAAFAAEIQTAKRVPRPTGKKKQD